MHRMFVVVDCYSPALDDEMTDQGAFMRRCERTASQALESLCVDRVAMLYPPSLESRLVVPAQVQRVVSNERDALERLTHAAQELGASAVIHLAVQESDFDSGRIDRLLAASQDFVDCDYIGFADTAGYFLSGHDISCPQWIRTTALARANREAYRNADRQGAERYIQDHPARFRLAYLSEHNNELGTIDANVRSFATASRPENVSVGRE